VRFGLAAQNFDHFVTFLEQRIHNGLGFLVIDYTGTLSQVIANKLPKDRIKDVFVYDARSQAPYSLPANFLIQYSGETSSATIAQAEALLCFIYGRGFSDGETELFELSVATLQDVLRNTPEYGQQICSPLSLARFLLDHDFRYELVECVCDVRLKCFLANPIDEYTAYQLAKKLTFATIDPSLSFGINAAPHDSSTPVFDPAEITRSGKIALITLPKSELDPYLIRYLSGFFFSRFERSTPLDFDLEQAYFFNGSRRGERNFLQDQPAFSSDMYSVQRRYSAMKYGRKNYFLHAQQAAFLPEKALQKLDPIFGARSIYDPKILTDFKK